MMLTQEDRVRRANEAAALMDNKYLTEAFEAVEREAIEHMIKAQTDEERRRGADTVKAIRDVRAALHAVITDGKYAVRRGPAVA